MGHPHHLLSFTGPIIARAFRGVKGAAGGPPRYGRGTDLSAAMAFKIAAFVLPLGIDTFAAAVALGLRRIRPLRPAVLFALFETVMPLIGIAAGDYAGRRFAAAAVYAGGAILIGIGTNIFREARGAEEGPAHASLGTLRGTVLAGFGISMDELAAGFPMGAARLPVPTVLAAIGLQAFVVTVAGIWAGRRLGIRAGRRTARAAETAAAAAFILLGMYTIAEQLVR